MGGEQDVRRFGGYDVLNLLHEFGFKIAHPQHTGSG